MKYLLFDIVSIELSKVTAIPIEDIYGSLEQPPGAEMGDVAFPCFSLAKTLKKAPNAISEDIRGKLLEHGASSLFADIKVLGGYLNFFFIKTVVLKQFRHIIKHNRLVDFSGFAGKKVTMEHTSVNPNASPHIGRARNAMIGDASVRLLRYLGYDVTVHYFVNDIGKQIAILVNCIKERANVSFSELLSLYVAANEELKSNPMLEGEVFDLLNRMENGDKEVFGSFSRIVDICVEGQMAIFNDFGIYYDVYDRESQYIRSGKTDAVLALLKNTGRLFEDAYGRYVLNLEEFEINSENPYLPLTRKDKTSLYPLRDICYNIDKLKESACRNIVVLGEDQRLYGRQINAVLSLLGYEGPQLINYSFVTLPEGKMSTREGQVVLLEDLMRDTISYAETTISEHRNEYAADDLQPDSELPKQLAYGAIKYAILKYGNEKNVLFDKEKAVNLKGDTSVYIQYSYARIQSMLRGESLDASEEDMAALTHPLEWEIVKKILLFEQVLNTVSQSFNFVSLCGYLYDLCQLFARWYQECRIKQAEGSARSARLFLSYAVANVIKDGLNILGIDAPERI